MVKSAFPTPRNLEFGDDVPFILISEELYKNHEHIVKLLIQHNLDTVVRMMYNTTKNSSVAKYVDDEKVYEWVKNYILFVYNEIEKKKKKCEIFRQLLSPQLIDIFNMMTVNPVYDDEFDCIDTNEIEMILSLDRKIGVTTMKYLENILKKLSVPYREVTKIINNEYEYPSAESIINILKPCIIMYPLKPAPLIIKKPSLNMVVLIAPKW
jgi:hypothetical protein